VLTPVYTPTRTDERNVSQAQVFFGGISVFLEQQVPLFRHTPRVFDRIWDAPWVIRLATKRQIKVDPASLGQMTVSMLRGEQGFQAKEIAKLLEWLRREPRFDVINLPYALLLGLAEPLRRELKGPVCCTLQGEDLFLDGLGDEHKAESLALIRANARHVDLFLPVSEYYRDFMPGYLGVPREKMRLVPLGINMEGYTLRPQRREPPFTVGYLARIAPEKGLHVLCEAYHVLRQREPIPAARLVAAGYLAPEHRPYLEEIRRKMREWGLEKEFEYRGEVDRAQKTAFLQSIDVFSVPAVYEEPKGLFLLEALANGVPVVQPKRGAFPEILDKTGGGLIVPSGDSSALADAWLDLWRDPEKAFALGRAGAQGVREHYDVGVMAEAAEQAYRSLAVTH
jgi:glycosyltransferase involved in cell wall biosynthesis